MSGHSLNFIGIAKGAQNMSQKTGQDHELSEKEAFSLFLMDPKLRTKMSQIEAHKQK